MTDTSEMVERKCPACGRQIEVLNGRWTQHTDPKSLAGKQRPYQCYMAGRRVDAALSPGEGR